MRRRVWGAASFVAAVACSPFSNAPPDVADASGEARQDAGGGDTAKPQPVADAAPPNLLPNGSFEDGCDWQGLNATVEETNAAQTGARACLVCVIDPALGYGAQAMIRGLRAAGSMYRGEVYVHAPPTDAGASAVLVMSELDAVADGGNGLLVAQGADVTPDATTWKRLTVGLTIPAGTATTTMYLKALADAHGRCFVMDDARIYQASAGP